MKALISGQAGIAVLMDGEACSSIEVHSLACVPRAAHDVPYLVGDASDLIELDGISRDEAARELEAAWSKDRSIHLALIALDREAASENRRSAVECLPDLLKDLPVADFVRNRLYAAPLPPSADSSGALELAVSSGSSIFAGILEEVRADQEPIRRNRLAWDALRPDLFGGIAEKEQFGFAAVESGMFRLLAQGKYDEALTHFDRFTRDHQTGVKWDVRRLARRWQRISALVEAGPPDRRPMGQSAVGATQGWTAGLRKLPPAAERTARAAGAAISRHRAPTAVACALLAVVVVLTMYLTPVSADATAMAGPGTGGIKASAALLRSEVRFARGGGTARRHFEMAEKAFSAGKFPEAARLYEMSGEAVDTLAAKLNFGIAVYNSSDLPKAASIFAAGLQIAREERIAILEGAFLTNLGNVSREQGRLEEAATLYRNAEAIDRGGDALGSATTAYNCGLLYVARGNFTEALSQFDIARQGYRHLGNKMGEADTLVQRSGLLRIILEANSEQSEDLRAAAQLFQQIPGPLAEASYRFAVGYRELYEGFDRRDKSSLERALDELKRAYRTYENIGYRRGQAVVMCSLGNAYGQLANSLEATNSYSECLSIATVVGIPFLQAIGYSGVGHQDIASGKPMKGLEQLMLASQVAERIGARGIEVSALEDIGAEYARRGESGLARTYLERAVKTAQDSGDLYLLIQAVRAPNYRTLGDAAKTRDALVRLRDLYAAVGNTTRSAEVQREIDQCCK
jgi:tetratricopeptide (TPR) repeat protein